MFGDVAFCHVLFVLGTRRSSNRPVTASTVSVTARFGDDSIAVDVEDDGAGMSDQQIERAMRRGGRVDEGKTGWGLGLSIVSDIVEEYAGDFKLSRSSLGGLKATVHLPGVK